MKFLWNISFINAVYTFKMRLIVMRDNILIKILKTDCIRKVANFEGNIFII